MSLSAHTINSTRGTSPSKRRVGRGNASTKGTYAGRGLKGQRSRSGGKGGLQKLGFKLRLLKTPKLRGFNSITPKKNTVTLAVLERICKDGETVTPALLEKRGVVSNKKSGVKVVARGELSKKLTLKGCIASKGALEKIEKAGGNIAA